MPKAHYTDKHGAHHTVEVECGYTLMEGAYNRQLDGMVAECGGACACGTCHCYVSEEWIRQLPPVEDLEDAMLYMVEDRQPNSRLTCQIHMSEDLDGIELTIADNA